jgi:long-chain acyl-CoA synthetase
MNLYDVFHETACRQPDHPAILGPSPQAALSYRSLDKEICGVAEGVLARAGLRPGDCVGLHCPSGVSYIIMTYATWRCGGCVVPIPVELAPDEKQQICREIGLRFVISTERGAGFLEPFHRGTLDQFESDLFICPIASPCEHPPGFAGVNGAFIRFTSGTTGAFKGVVLSHETIRDRIQAANGALHLGPADGVVWVLSMSYHFAVSIVSYLSFGAAIVLPANHFAAGILEATRRHQATLIYASPLHFAWIAAAEDSEPLPSLRLAVSTTTALDQGTADRFRRRFGLPLTQALGIIEVGLPFINVDFAADRPDAVGRVLPAYRWRLDDVGLGPHLREVVLSGPGFLDAYYRPWRTRSEILPDGWFHTGDVGEVDEDGCLFLRGRSKDLIDVMGMKFFPQEVEAVLMTHPRVESACVFARADERLGEVPCAQVVIREPGSAPSERELLEYCARRLAAFKVPQGIEFVKALRKTASGKLLHRDAGQPSGRDHEQHKP